MKHYEVVAGIIRKNQRILCVQRGESKFDYISGKFEFPGGKIEEGETREEALVRELNEELDLTVNNLTEFMTILHEYPDFKLTMHCFTATTENDQPNLKEHVSFKWLRENELAELDWAAADIPAVKKLEKGL